MAPRFRPVAFQSEATNLGTENYETNVYVRDQEAGRTLAFLGG